MKKFGIRLIEWSYRHIARPVIFLFPSEPVHEIVIWSGYMLTYIPVLPRLMSVLFQVKDVALATDIAGIHFSNPIGLTAGFDYKARLPKLLSGLGFGFGSVGTLTHQPYEGNPKPRIGRLPRSQSVYVNKGFKNEGIVETLKKHQGKDFSVPVGVSIGRTNTLEHTSQEQAVADVVLGFKDAEASGVRFGYYELNISCPNLLSPIEFYEPEKLNELLEAVTSLKLTRPIFIKMPIDRTEEQLIAMLDVIIKFPIAGIIVGNLQRNSKHPTLIPEEVAKYPKGNFSGKPTMADSTRCIELAYKHTKGALLIVGCGGVFTAEDAYEKIKAGASLIQLATGLVFQGPLVASEICLGLNELLTRDGFSHYREAVGKNNFLS